MRILVMGNSGSGKTTHARRLAEAHRLVHLELDDIVWQPGGAVTMRDPADVVADLDQFLAKTPAWVIDGCYGELIEWALPACSELLFLNPGLAVCLANNRRRRWEPHKYASKEEQDRMLESLQAWVEGYYTRDDSWSLKAHRRLFDSFPGRKRELLGSDDA